MRYPRGMALLKIYTGAAPVLRRQARPVRRIDSSTRKLVADMFETMHQAPGVGLAAPQIGLSERLLVITYEEKSYVAINPQIIARSTETVIGEEGCLSLPTIYGDVERAERVTVKATDLSNKSYTVEAEGWLARIFQHEIDHLDGIMFTDRMAPGAELRRIRTAATRDEI